MVGRVPVPIVDSHCHLQTLDPAECERALDRAREAGVTGFLVPAIRLEDSDRLLDLCSKHGDVVCALGVHPHEAEGWSERHETRLRDLLDEPDVVAVGECGLDFHYDLAPREVQLRVMRSQWTVAIDADLPVVVHNRESNTEMLRSVEASSMTGLRGVFHSFAGGFELAEQLVARGFYIGLSGMITFPRADNVREVLECVPTSRLLVETDTPYLAPVPYRGKPNRPAYVVEIAKRLAAELQISVAEAARRTTENFHALFTPATSGDRVPRD